MRILRVKISVGVRGSDEVQRTVVKVIQTKKSKLLSEIGIYSVTFVTDFYSL